MTLRNSIIGMLLFAIQLGVAIFFNTSMDLQVVVGVAIPTLGYILYKYFAKKYDSR